MNPKVFTEPIVAQLDSYRLELSSHPLLAAARTGELTPAILHEFAFQQYADSILWIPMLAQMKSKAIRSPRLRRAIEDNIACEAGLGSTAHIELARCMMRSLGLFTVQPFAPHIFAESAGFWLSEAFATQSEPEVAGWLLAAETLVPAMFAGMRPGFDAMPGCDTAYFDEHVRVDSDEHARWMAEAVDEVIALYGPDVAVAGISAGMRDARQETFEVPDALYAKLLR